MGVFSGRESKYDAEKSKKNIRQIYMNPYLQMYEK